MMKRINVDKIGSATSPIDPPRSVLISSERRCANVGDVIAVRSLSESVIYGNLELPSGRLAKINTGDIVLGVLGKRRALKGFVGDVPRTVGAADRLHLLNMGGVIGECRGHHSSLSDAIQVEVVGVVCAETGFGVNIQDRSLQPAPRLNVSAPIVMVGGSCMNSGKTVAAVEIIKQASNAGFKVAGAKLSGIACLRDTLNMEDHGAFVTASFLDCGLPSTVDRELGPIARSILNHLDKCGPDLIVAELGDGIVGGYGVDTILADAEIRGAVSSFLFCASDYVSVIGGAAVLEQMGIAIDVIAGSVTDSQMGEDFVSEQLGFAAGNARRDGQRLFELVTRSMELAEVFV